MSIWALALSRPIRNCDLVASGLTFGNRQAFFARARQVNVNSVLYQQGLRMPRNGENQDITLDRYRPLLRLQVRKLELDRRLRRRFDSSDLVQETLLKAHEGLANFRGQSEAEVIAWLQQILGNVVADQVRAARAKKRDVALEQNWDELLAASSARLETWLATNARSPVEQAERNEQVLRLAAAIEQLPDDQRDVVIQRDLLATSIAEIAEMQGRTEKSVAGLLLRGRRKLRELLNDD